MKIKKFGDQIPKRQFELEKGERLSLRLLNKQTGEEEEVMSFFMTGVLTLTWCQGAKLSDKKEARHLSIIN